MTGGWAHKRALFVVLAVVVAALCAVSRAGAYVYWTDGGSGGPGSIGRANPDGTNPAQVFIGGAGAPYGMAVDGQYVYWSNFSSSIWRAPLDGSGQPQAIITGLSTPSALAVDSQNIYWVNEGTDSIGRARLNDPGNPDATFIVPPPGNTIRRGLALDNGFIYWSNDNGTTQTIGRASLSDPTHPDTAFIAAGGANWGVAIGGGFIYWAANTAIGRASLADPAHPNASFVTGASGASAVAVDGQYVYWATGLGMCQGTCHVARASLTNPSSPELNFITGATLTYGIAVDLGAPVPASTRIPAITGSDQEGQTLTATAALWANGPTTVTRQWTRCDAGGAACVDLPGATGATYTLTAADVGGTIRVREIAANIWGPGPAALSVQTAVIASAIPSNLTPPSISGSAVHGQTLTSAHGAWSNGPTGFADQWLRCTPAGTACASIPGAIGQRYTLTAADVRSTIALRETASNAFGSGGPATSPATTPVSEPTPPTALTLPATAITQTSAVLHSRVNPGGGPTTALFRIGRKRSLVGATATQAQLVPPAGGAATVSATVAKLAPLTRYYYRVVATNRLSSKSVSGAIATFRTPAPPPRINSTMNWLLPPQGSQVAVRSLTISNVPLAARVEVDCTGGGCPFARRILIPPAPRRCPAGACGGTRRRATADMNLTGQFRGHLLATTAVLTVKITSRGWIGKEFVFRMSHATKPQIGCLAPGGSVLGQGC